MLVRCRRREIAMILDCMLSTELKLFGAYVGFTSRAPKQKFSKYRTLKARKNSAFCGGGGRFTQLVKERSGAVDKVELPGKFLAVLLDDPVQIDDVIIDIVDDLARSPLFPGEINRSAAEKRFDVC